MSPGYLSRLLGGGIEVKVSHIFKILELAGKAMRSWPATSSERAKLARMGGSPLASPGPYSTTAGDTLDTLNLND